MRLGRHAPQALQARVDDLLEPWRPGRGPLPPEPWRTALARGALRELELTPKPGLVDRRDSGSHPDLTLRGHAHLRGPAAPYYAGPAAVRPGGPAPGGVRRRPGRAEARMAQAIGANAHKGYIFLSGLALMAAGGTGPPGGHRRGGPGFFAARRDRTHGAQVRAPHGLGGIRAEAAGPARRVPHGWPAYREALDMGWAPDRAGLLPHGRAHAAGGGHHRRAAAAAWRAWRAWRGRGGAAAAAGAGAGSGARLAELNQDYAGRPDHGRGGGLHGADVRAGGQLGPCPGVEYFMSSRSESRLGPAGCQWSFLGE